jgi:glyoxylase-like metal-dependent hydrolase (beta-lactamase superfamily II)
MSDAGPWTDLGSGVRVRQSRLYAMNSGLLEKEDHVVLIDPGVLRSELDDIASRVPRPVASVTILFTHHHWDHVLGLSHFPEAETVGHDRLAAMLDAEASSIDEAARRHSAAAGEPWTSTFAPFPIGRAVSGQHVTRLGAFRAVLRDAPGHADTQLTAHVPELGLLFAADMLSDIEIPMLEGARGLSGGPVGAYRRTLEALRPLALGGAIETLVPGHGAIARGTQALERIDRDLAYLEALDRGVRASLSEGASLGATQARMASMDYLGKHAPYSMEPHHRDNVRAAFEHAAREPHGTAESRRPRPSPSSRRPTPRAGGRRSSPRRRSHAP